MVFNAFTPDVGHSVEERPVFVKPWFSQTSRRSPTPMSSPTAPDPANVLYSGSHATPKFSCPKNQRFAAFTPQGERLDFFVFFVDLRGQIELDLVNLFFGELNYSGSLNSPRRMRRR